MTRDEQIEAMWEAFDKVANSGMWTRKAAMQAVLDAADVEGMVRAAYTAGFVAGMHEVRGDKGYETSDDVVRRVCRR